MLSILNTSEWLDLTGHTCYYNNENKYWKVFEMADNKKAKLRKFEDWAEEYFNKEEDPDIKGSAKTFHDYCLNPRTRCYSEKRKYNYIDGLRKRILRRIQIIHGKYIGMYIKEYESSKVSYHENINYVDKDDVIHYRSPEICNDENIRTDTELIPQDYYEEIIDTYLPESDFDNKELSACRRIARKHYERRDELKLQLENAYKKLPFKISTEKIDEILNKVCCISDIDNISYKEITAEQKERFYKKFHKRFKSKEHSDKILKTMLRIKDLEYRINRCEFLFQKTVEKYYTVERITAENRFKYITKNEALAYIYILKIMNSRNFPNINLLRKLDDGYWELLPSNHLDCLIYCIEVLQDTENWRDVYFKIEDIEERLYKSVKLRNINKLQEVLDLFYIKGNSKDKFDDKVLLEIDKLIEQTDKSIHKFYCRYKKIIDKAKDVDISVLTEEAYYEKEREKKKKIDELHFKDLLEATILYNHDVKNDNESE